MERTTSSGVDGRSRDAIRKKEKDMALSPSRLADRPTAARPNAQFVVYVWGRAVVTPVSSAFCFRRQ
jgi:hypothetical protein